MKEIFLTQDQLDKTREELEYYVNTRRKEVVERIKEAKGFGDLSENSEYDSAREEQAFVEAKIKELETMLANAKIISDNVDTESVGLGTVVTYTNIEEGKDYTFRIVGMGSNPLHSDEPSISTGTPIGKKLLGKKVGEKVEVDIPSGKTTLEVKEIQ